jgi:hypothetical protein
MVVAGAILVILVAYPWFGCTITRDQVQASLSQRWAVFVTDGSAVGLTFNLTNSGRCDLHLQEVTITVHQVTYRDESVHALEFTETQKTAATILPGEMQQIKYTFDSIFPVSPVKMTMRVEMVFMETGGIVVFDGETDIPYPA